MTYSIEKIKELLNKIVPWYETNLTLFKSYIDEEKDLLDIFNNKLSLSNDWNIWFINSYDSEWTKKQILTENKNKSQPEEIVRQLYLIKLVHDYWYPKEFIKCEVWVIFGHEKKRADIVIYQSLELTTPWIIVEAKEPNQRNNIQQLKSYLNAEGSPIWVGINGRDINVFLRFLTDKHWAHSYVNELANESAKKHHFILLKTYRGRSGRSLTLTGLQRELYKKIQLVLLTAPFLNPVI